MVKHFVAMPSTYFFKYSSLLRQVELADLVWHRYFAECLKSCRREKLGVGVFKKVAGNCHLPTNWITSLRSCDKEAELLPYLSNIVVKEIQDKAVVWHYHFVLYFLYNYVNETVVIWYSKWDTVNETVITNGAGLGISYLIPCNMEEADETIFVHVKHASREHARILIKTVDSDVVVKAIAKFHQLISLNELWIRFGAT